MFSLLFFFKLWHSKIWNLTSTSTIVDFRREEFQKWGTGVLMLSTKAGFALGWVHIHLDVEAVNHFLFWFFVLFFLIFINSIQINFPLDSPKIISHSFWWQDNQFGVDIAWHDGSGNGDRRKEEKPFSLQKLKVWFNKSLWSCVIIWSVRQCVREQKYI